MPKRSITAKIKNGSDNSIVKTTAIIQDDIIKYKEVDNTIVKYNYSTNELIRENKELRMSYQFIPKKKTTGKVYIKELANSLEVNIKTQKIKRKNYDIEIDLKVE